MSEERNIERASSAISFFVRGLFDLLANLHPEVLLDELVVTDHATLALGSHGMMIRPGQKLHFGSTCRSQMALDMPHSSKGCCASKCSWTDYTPHNILRSELTAELVMKHTAAPVQEESMKTGAREPTNTTKLQTVKLM